MADNPNPVSALASMVWARRVAPPAPVGHGHVDHSALSPILEDLRTGGISTLPSHVQGLDDYRSMLSEVAPNSLAPADALAFWVNLYNAGALLAAARAYIDGLSSILRIPGVFRTPDVVVDGEALSLDDIEHGKVRRFGDPRIHAALVCGSVSCPTLRFEPFDGSRLNQQLEDQMRSFLMAGAMRLGDDRRAVSMSSIFLLYGADFVRPDWMPSLRPVPPGQVRDTVAWWLPAEQRDEMWSVRPRVEFQAYDWGLACSVA